MDYKKIIIVLVLAIFLFSITSVCASEIDDPIASEDTNQIGLSDSGKVIEYNRQTSGEKLELSVDDESLNAQTDTDVLGDTPATYSDLAEEINTPGNVTLKHKNYTYNNGATAIIISDANKGIDGNGAVIDMLGSTIRAFHVSASGVTIKNLTIKNANYNGNGGAIYFDSTGTVANCNFVDNKATGDGGAINMGSGTVSNCNFTDNTAKGDGGAVCFNGEGNVTNCNFTGNTASRDGGAVYFWNQGTVSNCNFTDNTASRDGGAVYFDETGTVSNCNFTDNTAKMGNAIYINNKCTISDCNFTNNPITKGAIHSVTGDITLSNNIINVDDVVSDKNFTEIQKLIDRANDGDEITINGLYAGFGIPIRITKSLTLNGQNNTTLDAKKLSKILYITANNVIIKNIQFTSGYAEYGGAVYFNSNGEVTNCNFTGNTATYGGAVYFRNVGEVTNCNFTGNTAGNWGGAVYFWKTGSVSNCNFTGNTVSINGGAVYFDETGTVSNCNFTNNSASSQGGAIRFSGTGTVTNCNFTGNNATTGSAIYFWSTSSTKTVSNSRFLNNRANSEALEVTKNNNNITITFTGKDNLLNAIYSRNDGEVTFTNVTYWSANGIANTGSSPTTPSRSNKEAGQNITVGVVVNDKLVLNEVKVTDENGMIVLDIIAGENYYISARHDTDSYYTEAERTISNNTKFNVNVTSQTTTNKTVNITAKSNIPQDVVQGKLLFILPNGTQIEATYGANGTWWAEHTFDAYGEYKVNATYVGLDNVTINNGTITINKVNSTITLENIVLDYGETKNVTVTTTGATGITAKIDGNNVTVINNYTIQIPVLDAGTYNLTVTTIPDDDHNPVTKEVNITVNKVNSTLTVNDIVFDYGSSGSTVVSLTGADGVNATVVGQPKAVVKVNGTNITVSDLDAGTYTLTVTTIADKNHNNITKNATITVNKVNATLTVNDVVLDYGESKNITVTTEGATGITAKIDGVDVTVSNYTIPVSGLGAGNYTLTVTTIADDNHKPVTKEANITVNKVNATLTVNDVVLDYGESKNITVTTEGATGITAKIDGVDVTVSNYTIPVSGLGAGNYTLTVTTIADDNHKPVTKEANITVNKVNATLTVNDVVLDYGESKNITVTTEGATGITAKIDGVNVTVKGYTIPISGLGAGNYTLTVTTIPDDNHKPVTKEANITVNKVNATLTVDGVVLDYGESKNITVTTEGATGITAKIDGVNVTVKGYTIPISGLGAGNYTLTVTTIPDDNHKPVTVTSKITVNKVESTLTVGDIVFDYDGEGSGDVSFTGASEVIANVVNQPSAVVSVNDNKITVSGLGAGTYTLNVTTVPDENHTAVTETATITVNKVNSTLTLDDVELNYGDSKNVTVATEGATGITAKIDGVDVTVNNYSIPISGLGAGNYTLTVTTIADKNHNPVTKEVNITVNKLSTEIILANETLDLKVGDEVPVLANLAPVGAGNLTFTSSNEGLVFVEDNVTIVANSQGQAIITVSFAGNENYTAAENKTITVNVALNDASVTVDNNTLDLKVGETYKINATKNPDTILVDMTYTSGNSSVVRVDENGIVTAVGEGSAIITVEVGDDEIYAKNSTSITVTVNKLDANATVSIPENVTVCDNSTVNVKLPSDATGNVTLKADGEVVDAVPVSNGTASVGLPSLSAGNHTVEIAYSGDEKYNPVSETKDITVSKQNATADVTVPSDITVGDDSNVNVKLPSDATGNVTVKVDGEVVDSVPVTDGTANLTIPSLKAGNHTVEIAYSGDEKYNPASETQEITVSKQDTTPEIDVEGSNVDVKLPSDATGNVTVKVDDTVVSTVPVTDGTASVKLPKLSAGNHTVEIAYSGDDKYSPSTETTIVSVDKDSTKLTANNVTATYKVEKYLTITLTDSRGSPIANATVSVELKSLKNYTTDANGQVKVKVSSLVPKTYTAKITFNGDDNYIGSNTTAKVVVKKAASKITAKAKTFKTTTKTKKYTVTLKANGKALKNKWVYLKVNGKTYKAKTNSKGKATFKITQLNKAGKFKATVTFKGNDYYKKATKKATIKVKSVWKTVQKGSKNSAIVKKIQRALKNHGYYLEYNGHYLMVDGIFWDYTEMAVKEFQNDKTLKVTGKVDEKTARKLGII